MGIEHVPSVAMAGILWTHFEDTDQVRTFANLAKKHVHVNMFRISQMRPTSTAHFVQCECDVQIPLILWQY